MKNKWVLFIILVFFLAACDKSEDAQPEPVVNNVLGKDTVESIESKYGITEPYFYTGLINGVRHTYQTSGSNGYVPFFSEHQLSSGGVGTRGVSTGFFSHLTLDIYHEYGYFGIPDTSQIFYLNKNYTCSNSSNIANDTLRYNLRYSVDGKYFRSDCCPMLNENATLRFTEFLPGKDRSFPLPDIEPRYRCEIDSLIFHGGSDTLIFTDFIIQTKYK